MNKVIMKNVLVILVVFAIATMTACNLATPTDTSSSVEVVLDGIGGAGGARGTIADADWVRINVKLTADGVQKGSGDLTYTANAWRGKISVSETGPMTFEATAGNQDGTTGVYHVSWSGSNTLTVADGVLKLTIPVTAGGDTRHIFYVNANSASDGWRYLEAAPSDQSTGITWITGGATQTTTNGNTATAIGTGKANTAFMAAQAGYTGGAAKVCKDYAGGGYSDWFLPSKDELSAMYFKNAAIGGFAAMWYWSSSEYDASNAWIRGFGGGNTGINVYYKYSTYYLRAVRAF